VALELGKAADASIREELLWHRFEDGRPEGIASHPARVAGG
jgi:hypothetical protein